MDLKTQLVESKMLLLRTGTIVDATLIASPNSIKTAANAMIQKCTRPRNASNGTLV